ncbi:hypothetical protein Tco_0221826 [Tanacetum coccineum]
MSTYLKNMAGYKHNQLKNKSFDDIQKLFDKAMKRVNTFIDIDTELVEGSEQKVDDDKETTELQRLIEVIPDKEKVAIDVVHLATKPPSIVNYKIHKEEKKTYYQIIRAGGSLKVCLVFSHMSKLCQGKIWNPVEIDQVWRNQQDYRVLDWKIYDSCGVHSLRMQHMHIHMLVEKRYPLTPATITDMLNKKLQCDHFSEMLLMKKLEILKKNIKFRGGLLGLKDFMMIFKLLLLRHLSSSINILTSYLPSFVDTTSIVQ